MDEIAIGTKFVCIKLVPRFCTLKVGEVVTFQGTTADFFNPDKEAVLFKRPSEPSNYLLDTESFKDGFTFA